jgi:hypothetical protein
MITRTLDFLYSQKKLLASSCYNVFFVAVFECSIEGLLKFGNGLDWTHRTNVFLLFLFNLTTSYEQVFLISSSINT